MILVHSNKFDLVNYSCICLFYKETTCEPQKIKLEKRIVFAFHWLLSPDWKFKETTKIVFLFHPPKLKKFWSVDISLCMVITHQRKKHF